MTIETPTITPPAEHEPAPDLVRHRDAAKTRQLLLDSARRRFAIDGYASTTVRDIATDAGVNVALINRYFTSKEGLFEACLQRVVSELDSPDASAVTFDEMGRRLVEQVADSATRENPLQLLLLLRSSGDDNADRMRRDTLRSYAESMATVAGWTPEDEDSERTLLRAQVAIAAGLGIVLLRSSGGVEPLTSATAADLAEPIGDVLRALMLKPAQRE